MKQIVTTLMAILIMASVSFAQNAAPAAGPKPKTEKKMPADKKDGATKHTKADGSPDRRFKENKTPKVHTKADGSPDRRFKENKMKDKAAK